VVNPRAAASSATGEGCETLLAPRPLGRPGCVTTAATCARVAHALRPARQHGEHARLGWGYTLP
jgi:hypothetical protein